MDLIDPELELKRSYLDPTQMTDGPSGVDDFEEYPVNIPNWGKNNFSWNLDQALYGLLP